MDLHDIVDVARRHPTWAFPSPVTKPLPVAISTDVVVGTDKKTGEPVALPYAVRDRGVTIVGKSGTGKSTVLERLILADLAQGTPSIVIDPHGPLSERIIKLAPAAAADRIVLLDPSVSAFGLN